MKQKSNNSDIFLYIRSDMLCIRLKHVFIIKNENVIICGFFLNVSSHI